MNCQPCQLDLFEPPTEVAALAGAEVAWVREYAGTYAVSTTGQVWSHAYGSWRLKKPSVNSSGYQVVVLYRNNKGTMKYVHALVLEAFVGPRPAGAESRHYDGCRLHNSISNLSWGSHSENQLDKRRHGTAPQGERHHHAKLTALQIAEIRHRCGNGDSQQSVAREYGVTRAAIGSIMQRRSWRHVP